MSSSLFLGQDTFGPEAIPRKRPAAAASLTGRPPTPGQPAGIAGGLPPEAERLVAAFAGSWAPLLRLYFCRKCAYQRWEPDVFSSPVDTSVASESEDSFTLTVRGASAVESVSDWADAQAP